MRPVDEGMRRLTPWQSVGPEVRRNGLLSQESSVHLCSGADCESLKISGSQTGRIDKGAIGLLGKSQFSIILLQIVRI